MIAVVVLLCIKLLLCIPLSCGAHDAKPLWLSKLGDLVAYPSGRSLKIAVLDVWSQTFVSMLTSWSKVYIYIAV